MGEPAAYVFAQVTDADLDDLARLRLDWSRSQGLTQTPDFEGRFRDWWARQSGHRVAWVGRAGERAGEAGPAVAMANVQLFERMPRPGVPDARWAYVANVWVDVEHRRRGVATALMTEVVTWCRVEGMQRIVLNPSEMSLPLYRALGFRPADDLMRLDL